MPVNCHRNPMLGTAAVQALMVVAIATAPSAASTPDGLARAYLASATFIALWLVAAGLFWRAALAEGRAGAA